MSRLHSTILISLFLVFSAWGQATVEEIRREIRRVKEETKHEEKLAASEEKRATAFRKNSESRLKKMKSESATLSARNDSLTAELKKLRAAKKKLMGSTRWFEKKRKNFSLFLAGEVDSIRSELAADFPYRKEEQSSSLAQLSRQLRDGSLGPEEGMGRLWSQLLEVLKVAYGSENWSGRFTRPDGSTVAGKFLRFGAVFQSFVSADDREVWWLENSFGNWLWHSVGSDIVLRQALKEALRVSEGKTAPRMVKLPLLLQRGGEK